MRTHRGWLGPVFAIVVPYLAFEWLRHSPFDLNFPAPSGHFYIVSLVALMSTVIGVAVGVAGGRLRNIKVTFLALSFISLAGVFTVHGLATPGLIMHQTNVPGISAQLSVLLASVWLFLSSLPSDHAAVVVLSRGGRRLMSVWMFLLVLFALTGLLFPHGLDMIPLNRNPLRGVATALIVIMNGYTVYAYYRSYRYSGFPLQHAIVYSAGWFIVAQFMMVLGTTWNLSWWLYHFVLLSSMIVMLLGLFRQYAARGSVAQAVQSLFHTNPVDKITHWISPSIKALIVATESKDTYTAGHNFRVTMFALRLAEEMGVRPEQMRALAQGAIVHDVGKINIPDAILNKPGRLTDAERAVIEQHPGKGYEMCRNLGFMSDELGVIRSHHEKWDGTGYPDRLAGERIPLLARITAVADVYDALTSNRAYRRAWSHEEAIRLLSEQRGSHFDPGCVDAWIRICERDPRAYLCPAVISKEQYPINEPSSPAAAG